MDDETLLKQKQQVESLLELDPTNEQFLKMRDDLDKLYAMRQQIAEMNNANAAGSGAGAGSEQAGDDEDDDDDNNDEDNGVDSDLDDLEPAARAPPAPIDPNSPFVEGTIVEVIGSDRPYPGVVTAVLEGGATFRVKYYEFDTEVTLPRSNLTRVRPSLVHKEDVAVGFKGQAVYPVDQLFYDATVTSLTEHGCVVLYTQYGNSCEIPINYLKPLQTKSVKKPADPNALIKIPDNLKILPTDTEAERERKKKRIKAIKSKNRMVTKEAEAASTQNSWKKFVNKATKRNVEGVNKASMFASPEAIEGKVGVTNSGKGLTDFASRKKHKF